MPVINSIISMFSTKRLAQIDFFKENPIQVQRDTLVELLRRAADTEYGLKYDFDSILTAEQYRELLVAARDANMNILRLWGGSGFKKKEFYEICDELGIMLWQEFVLACNNYVGTPAYLQILEQEATAVIRELRCHPSIVLWCGGNELFNDWSALRLLNKLCYENDFD